MATLSDATLVVVARDALTAEVSPGLVVLNVEDGVYYGLEDVGARVWALVQSPIAVGEIRAAIVDEYDVDPEQCDRDLEAFLASLIERGLVTLC